MDGLSVIAHSIDSLPYVEYYPLTNYSITSLLITEKEDTFLVIKAEWEAMKKRYGNKG